MIYRPLANDFSTPIIEAGMAIAITAIARFGSNSATIKSHDNI